MGQAVSARTRPGACVRGGKRERGRENAAGRRWRKALFPPLPIPARQARMRLSPNSPSPVQRGIARVCTVILSMLAISMCGPSLMCWPSPFIRRRIPTPPLRSPPTRSLLQSTRPNPSPSRPAHSRRSTTRDTGCAHDRRTTGPAARAAPSSTRASSPSSAPSPPATTASASAATSTAARAPRSEPPLAARESACGAVGRVCACGGD